MKKAIVVLFVFLSVQTLTAEVIVFNQNAVLNGDYDGVSIEGDAEVSITGGTIQKIYILDDTTVHFSGGTIEEVLCYDDSELTITGNATIEALPSSPYYEHGRLSAYGNSIITISGGFIKGSTTFYNTSMLHLQGGIFERDGEGYNSSQIDFYDYSTFYFYSGDPAPSSDKTFSITLYNNALGYMSGGTLKNVSVIGGASFYMTGGTINDWLESTNKYGGWLSVYGDAKAYISGGYINTIGAFSEVQESVARDLVAGVYIYGNNLSLRPYGPLSGKWLDDMSFSINVGEGSYSNITLHEGETPPDPFSGPASSSKAPLDAQVLSYNLKQGKTTGTDKLIVSGRLNTPANLDLSGKDMVIECGSYLEVITIPEGKNGVFRYKGQGVTDGTVSLAIFDLSKGTFKIAILNADLSDANPGEFYIWAD